MRFKYLTATLLREAANAILAGEREFMCTAIRDVGSQEARKEFEQVLEEMEVSTCGNLRYCISPDDTYKVVGFDGYAFEEDARFTRAFFLHMLADAIAYKAPKKIDYRWRDALAEPPQAPGIYEKEFDDLGVPQFQYWDGTVWHYVWHYGKDSYTAASSKKYDSNTIALLQDRRWRHVRPQLKKT